MKNFVVGLTAFTYLFSALQTTAFAFTSEEAQSFLALPGVQSSLSLAKNSYLDPSLYTVHESSSCRQQEVITSTMDPNDTDAIVVHCNSKDGNRIIFQWCERAGKCSSLGDARGYTREQLTYFRDKSVKAGLETSEIDNGLNYGVGFVVIVLAAVGAVGAVAGAAGAAPVEVASGAVVGTAVVADVVITDAEAEATALAVTSRAATPQEVQKLVQYLSSRPVANGKTLGEVSQGFARYLSKLPKGQIKTFDDIEKEVPRYFSKSVLQNLSARLPAWAKNGSLGSFTAVIGGLSAWLVGVLHTNLNLNDSNIKLGNDAKTYLSDTLLSCSGCVELSTVLIPTFAASLGGVLALVPTPKSP